MRHILLPALAVIVLPALAFTQSPRKGPLVDRLILDTRTQEEPALRDAAEGKIDLLLSGLTGGAWGALTQEAREALDAYPAPAGTWHLLFNPYPNRPPYTASVGTRTYFNPFSIREVRFAMNFLLDRKTIVEDILGGAGDPLLTSVPTRQPGAYRFNLLAARMGLTPTANEKKALQMITDALTRAAALQENSGRLTNAGGWWLFDGEPVTVKFLIRVDDPEGRLRLGRMAADLIESAGIKVERLEFDRKKCFAIYQDGDPAGYEWNIYTEAYGPGETGAWWDSVVIQNHAPLGANMPGGRDPEHWNYENPDMDTLARPLAAGHVSGEQEYWDRTMKLQEAGLTDAIRIPVCSIDQLFAANRARVSPRMVYGLGDGVNGWSLRTADLKAAKGAQKTLKVSILSPKGTLFTGAWDPVGAEGFADDAALFAAAAATDGAAFTDPVTGLDAPWRAAWKDVQSKVHMTRNQDGRDTLAGDIPVPPDAIQYDSATKAWKKVGPGVTSFSRATYSYKWGKWHSGRPLTIGDVMYAAAFVKDWTTRDGSQDRSFDAAYEAALRPAADRRKGLVLNKDGTVTAYFDFIHPSRGRVAAQGAPWVGVSASTPSSAVSWEITEASARLVMEGGVSGTRWSFSADPAYSEIDLRDPACIADLAAKLKEMRDARSVPPSVKRWVTAADAAASCEAAMAWIAAHGNAYISNGPFFVDRADAAAATLELAAYREGSYPFEAGYWNKQLRARSTRIKSVNIPSLPARGKEAVITASVSVVDFPSGAARPADAAVRLKLTVFAPTGEKSYKGVFLGAGTFAVNLPAADMGQKPGAYTVVAESSLGDEPPSVEAAVLQVY